MRNEVVKSNARADSITSGASILGWVHAIRRRKSLVFFGIVIGLGIGAIYYARVPPVYESTAKIMILKRSPDSMPVGDSRLGGNEDHIANQISMIRSPVIAEQVAGLPSIIALEQFANKTLSQRSNAILTGMRVGRGELKNNDSTSVITISYRSGKPADCIEVIRGILECHKKVMATSYQDLGQETVQFIEEASKALSTELQEKEDKYQAFVERTLYQHIDRDKDPKGGVLEGRPQTETSPFQGRREVMLLRDAEIRSHLKALEQAKKAGRSAEALLGMAERFASVATPGATTEGGPSDQLISLLAQEREMSEEFGPDNKDLRRLRARISLVRSLLPKSKSGFPQTEKRDPVERHVQNLMDELECNACIADAYSSIVQQEMAKKKEALRTQFEGERMAGELARTRQLWDLTLKRLQETSLIKNMVGLSSTVLAEPTEWRKVSPVLYSTCIISLVSGMLFGLILVYLAETSDRSFRGPDDVMSRLGVPIISHMPIMNGKKLKSLPKAKQSGLAITLCAALRPRSREAEAIRGIRTSILFHTKNDGSKIIQFTSPQPGDGKSTLAANVAISMAQAGKRVILVEADLRRPSLQGLFGREPELGFSQVLEGTHSWKEVIEVLPDIPNLEVIFCGAKPKNPAELLTSSTLSTALSEMKSSHDYVIVDSPPLLPVTDPCSIAACVDGLILVIPMGRNTRPNAERACSLLDSIEAPIIGAIMNKVTKDGGYANGYTDAYGYGYGDKRYGYYARNGIGDYITRDPYYEQEPSTNGADNHQSDLT